MYKKLGIKTVAEETSLPGDEQGEILPDEKNSEKLLDIESAN